MQWLTRWWVEREPVESRIRRESLNRLRHPARGTREWATVHNYEDETPWIRRTP